MAYLFFQKVFKAAAIDTIFRRTVKSRSGFPTLVMPKKVPKIMIAKGTIVTTHVTMTFHGA
ncbi:hypothetical protein IID27_03395 [Patescibacteria group bacterium]|nr:hypothetical protein [Patescibacteria group bacterium]